MVTPQDSQPGEEDQIVQTQRGAPSLSNGHAPEYSGTPLCVHQWIELFSDIGTMALQASHGITITPINPTERFAPNRVPPIALTHVVQCRRAVDHHDRG